LLKIFLFILLGVALLIFIAMIGLAMLSHRSGNVGLIAGKLRDCPDAPNCVCSECTHNPIEAIHFSAHDKAQRWQQHLDAITYLGGKIKKKTDQYMWATFRTPVFRFVDDIELRLDDAAQCIQIRSASRVGHSDFGVNLRRAKQIQQRVFDNDD